MQRMYSDEIDSWVSLDNFDSENKNHVPYLEEFKSVPPADDFDTENKNNVPHLEEFKSVPPADECMEKIFERSESCIQKILEQKFHELVLTKQLEGLDDKRWEPMEELEEKAERLEELEEKLERLEELEEKLEHNEKQINELEGRLEKLEELEGRLEKLEGRIVQIDELELEEELERVDKLEKMLEQNEKRIVQMEKFDRRIAQIDELEEKLELMEEKLEQNEKKYIYKALEELDLNQLRKLLWHIKQKITLKERIHYQTEQQQNQNLHPQVFPFQPSSASTFYNAPPLIWPPSILRHQSDIRPQIYSPMRPPTLSSVASAKSSFTHDHPFHGVRKQ